MRTQFRDRIEAGRLLAKKLTQYANRDDVLVLGLPRGGLPVAFEVAKALNAPLDVCVVRKLGVPGQEELAMGAIALGGVRVLNTDLIRSLHTSEELIDEVAAREQKELERRERLYRGARPAPLIEGRIVLLIDDGIATGATMRAAAKALRQQRPARLVIAVPVAPSSVFSDFAEDASELIVLMTPANYFGVGEWYEDFSQTSDDEVRRILRESECFAPRTDQSAPQKRR